MVKTIVWLVTFACTIVLAQTQLVLSDIPFWPKNGVLPPDLAAKQFVYYDIATDEIVVSYPADGGTGPRITFRYEPQNLVSPDVQVSVQRQANGQYFYDYQVTNQPTGKRPIGWFSLVVPSTDDSVSLAHPAWAGFGMKASTPGVAPQAGLYAGPQLRVQANMGKFVAWGQGAKSTAIGPGTSQAGFHLSSSFRPGITTAYFYTGKALRVPAELPPAVADQLLPLLQPEKDYKGVLTIGPKYGQAHHDDIWIAGDLAYGIRRMVNSNQLPADSPFIAEVIAELTAITRNGKAVNFAFKAKPGSPLEQELATAVPLSFAH